MVKCRVTIKKMNFKKTGAFYIIKRGSTLMYSAKTKASANRKAKHVRENYC